MLTRLRKSSQVQPQNEHSVTCNETKICGILDQVTKSVQPQPNEEPETLLGSYNRPFTIHFYNQTKVERRGKRSRWNREDSGPRNTQKTAGGKSYTKTKV